MMFSFVFERQDFVNGKFELTDEDRKEGDEINRVYYLTT